MKLWEDKNKMVLIMIMAIALAFVLGVFVGRISMYNTYYLS